MAEQSVCKWPRCACKATGVYCAQKARKSDKKAPKPLKRTAIKPRSEKGKIKALEKKDLVQTDMVFYLQLWDHRPHICYETGEIIHKPHNYNFHHVLEKKPYPQYRHREWNIVFVTWMVHDKVHRGIDFAPKIKKLTQFLLKMHENGELETLTDAEIMVKIHNID